MPTLKYICKGMILRNESEENEEFKFLEMIGMGGFGEVWKGVHKKGNSSPNDVAIKICHVDPDEREDSIFQLEEELKITREAYKVIGESKYDAKKKVRSPAVYSAFMTDLDPLPPPHNPNIIANELKETREYLVLVLEYIDGISLDVLSRRCQGSVGLDLMRYIVVELTDIMHNLHQNRLIHRDIKAANVLVSSSGRLCLCDYGVSALCERNQTKRSTFVGSPYWVAPEVVVSLSQTQRRERGSMVQISGYTDKIDVWSLGITVMEVCLGKPPLIDLYADQPIKAMTHSVSEEHPLLEDFTDDADLKEFCQLCLVRRPADRASTKKLMNSRLIRKNVDDVNAMQMAREKLGNLVTQIVQKETAKKT